jgi:hypothetical protein
MQIYTETPVKMFTNILQGNLHEIFDNLSKQYLWLKKIKLHIDYRFKLVEFCYIFCQ